MAKKKKEAKVVEHSLTPAEALGLLAPHLEGKKKRVHTFMGMGFGLMGCDYDLTDVKKHLKEAKEITLSGPNMRGMGHGVAFLEKDQWTFLESDKKKIDAIHKARGIKD